MQTPFKHKQGLGCPKCAGRNKTTEDIVGEFHQIHGSTYDYSKVNYTNGKTMVDIICAEHGLFKQLYSTHIRGSGCPRCFGKNQLVISVLKTFNEVHSSTYNYSKVNYINNQTLVDIMCSEHGLFKQLPSVHASGGGCPKCEILNQNNNFKDN